MYVYWGVALGLLLTGGLLCWKVVVPYYRTREVVTELATGHNRRLPTLSCKEAIARLGGRENAFEQAVFYFRLPAWIAPERASAVRILSGCGEAALPHVSQAMKDEDVAVREAAASTLGAFGQRGVPNLIEALHDEDVGVRFEAAWSLERLGPRAKRAIPALEEALKDEGFLDPIKYGGPAFGHPETVRAAAARALGSIGDTQAIGSLIPLLKDKNWRVRKASVGALEKLRNSQALGPLKALLKDEREEVRQAAAEALKKIKAAQEKKK